MPIWFVVDDNDLAHPVRSTADGEIYTVENFPRYKEILEESVGDASLSAGDNTLNGSVVPAGEIWLVTLVYMDVISTDVTKTQIRVSGLASLQHLYTFPTPLNDTWMGGVTNALLQEGDKMQLFIEGAAAGDDGYLRYSGWKAEL
jgi:hypothetical protein